MTDFADADFGSIGDAASDLFSGIGAMQAAGSYRTSAKYARRNAKLEEESFRIKQAQLGRELFRAQGGQKADIAAAGFKLSGSGIDLVRDSAQQGALAKAALSVQKDIAVNTYTGQADAAEQSAAAEDTAAIGSFIGTALNVAAFALPFILSDRRAKHSIVRIGSTPNGLPWYSFSYLGSSVRREGLMSDDVRAIMPEAVVVGADGFERVNYDLALGAN